MVPAINRLEGYKKALQGNDFPFQESLVHIVGTTMKEGYQVMSRLLQGKLNFTAVFAFNDVIAYGCLRVLREKRFRVPEDIAIIGYDDSEMDDVVHPRLTSIRQPTYEMGKQSAELMITLVETRRTDAGPVILFEPELRIRETT